VRRSSDRYQLKPTTKKQMKIFFQETCKRWLLVGTEEEHWFYKLMI
jgi:hypothetical protein